LVGSEVIVATCDRTKRNLLYSLCCGVGEQTELENVLAPLLETVHITFGCQFR